MRTARPSATVTAGGAFACAVALGSRPGIKEPPGDPFKGTASPTRIDDLPEPLPLVCLSGAAGCDLLACACCC